MTRRQRNGARSLDDRKEGVGRASSCLHFRLAVQRPGGFRDWSGVWHGDSDTPRIMESAFYPGPNLSPTLHSSLRKACLIIVYFPTVISRNEILASSVSKLLLIKLSFLAQ